jgi:single-strand DNA-binding protein
MPNLNKVMLIGNLTRDPEIKYTPKGTAICQFGLAVNRVYTAENSEKREEVTFIDVEAFARLAEVIGEYCKKGEPIFIEGRLRLDQWDDKQSGQKRSKMKVICETMQLLGQKGGGSERPPVTQPQPTRRPAATPTPAADPDLDATSGDLPY